MGRDQKPKSGRSGHQPTTAQKAAKAKPLRQQVREIKWEDLVREIENAGWVEMGRGSGSTHFRWQRKGNSAGAAFEPTVSGGKLKDIAVRFGIEHLVAPDPRKEAKQTRGVHLKSGKPLTVPASGPSAALPLDVQEPERARGEQPPFWPKIVPLHVAGRIALLNESADESCMRCGGVGMVTCPKCFAETKDIVVTIIQAALQEVGKLRDENKKLKVLVERLKAGGATEEQLNYLKKLDRLLPGVAPKADVTLEDLLGGDEEEQQPNPPIDAGGPLGDNHADKKREGPRVRVARPSRNAV